MFDKRKWYRYTINRSTDIKKSAPICIDYLQIPDINITRQF